MSLFAEPETKELLRLAKKLEESSIIEISVRNQCDSVKRKINTSFENSKKNEQTILDLISLIETEMEFQEDIVNEEEEEEDSETENINEIIQLEDKLKSLYKEKEELKSK